MSEVGGIEAVSALVRESAVSGVQRRALLLRTDVLPPSLSRPQHLRRAREALDPLLMADRGRCHELSSGRIVISWRGDAPKLMRETVDALDSLLREDPFDAPGINQLIGWYDLPADGAKLLREASVGMEPIPAAPTPAPMVEPVFDMAMPLEPLDTAALERLEQSLALADLSRFARRRAISHLTAQGMMLAWEERTLSIPELIATVAPGCDVKSDPWLFRRLTRLLDRRMLSILSNTEELRDAGPFGITLNVASVLSSEFLRFDAGLPGALRNRIVISLLPADIAADAGAYAFARNFARGRGYRICLRAVTASLLPALDLAALELDLVQLVWSASIGRLSELPSSGGARWIMGRPCTDEAVKWGVQAGIGLFATKPTV
jgi:hypothetical protein